MAYLDPASNPRSKPQRLCATNCKSSTPDKLQIFRTIFGISCKYLTKIQPSNLSSALSLKVPKKFVKNRRKLYVRVVAYALVHFASPRTALLNNNVGGVMVSCLVIQN